MWVILFFAVIVSCSTMVASIPVDLPECEPPDYPEFGGYGPNRPFYVFGDVISYYCDPSTHLGFSSQRRCEDTGDWSGDAPVCDLPAVFRGSNQTSTAEPAEVNGPDKAYDSLKGTCSSTVGRPQDTWYGYLASPGQVMEVVIYMSSGFQSLEVYLLRPQGKPVSCGKTSATITANLHREVIKCPMINDSYANGVKIKTYTNDPLQICEVEAYVKSPISCKDPHIRIVNGRLELTRTTATLVCNAGFSRSPETRLECIRNGVWNRKMLYCDETNWGGGNYQRSPNQNS